MTTTCPACHSAIPADSPDGACPRCALSAGLREDATTAPSRTEPAAVSVESVAKRLPGYEDFQRIGRGGMGTVFRARQRRLQRPVAIKVIAHADASSATFRERFVREARTLARLSHPNIVSVYDFGECDGLHYLVMELVEGVTLRQVLKAGTLEPTEALSIVPRLCEALQYAHDQGVVHRDIKPENILIDARGAVKIADFGLAKLTDPSADTRLTMTAQVMGTPHYMAPEQIEHPDTVDHRADIFALGVVFYEMLTGELPVGRFPPPSDRVDVGGRLDRIVLRTLEKEPRRRYQQVSELKTDVESVSVADEESDDSPEDETYRARDFEYRTKTRILGLPLVHILFGRSGTRMARGIVAVGDTALGVIAMGGVACGGVALGGVSLGLLGAGGVTAGLLASLGGLSIGAFATGGVALGVVARGRVARELVTLSDSAMQGLAMATWLTLTVIVSGLVCAGLVAWARQDGRSPGRS